MKNYAKKYQEQKVNFIYSLLGLCFEGTTEEDANKFIEENYEKANDIYWDMIDQEVEFVQEYRFITEKQEKEIERLSSKFNVKFNGNTYEHALLFIHKYNNKEKLEQETEEYNILEKIMLNKKEYIDNIENTLNINNEKISISNLRSVNKPTINNDFSIFKKDIDRKKKKLKEEYKELIKNATSKYNSSVPKLYRYSKNNK